MKYQYHHALGGTATDGGLEQNEQELLMLTDFIKRKRITSFLEIGIAKGDLQRYMMEQGLQCFGVTPYKKDSHEGITVIYGESQDGHVIEKVRALLSRVTPSTPNPEPKFDLIFVDGDHSYNAVKADYKNYKGMCRYMAFHDIAGRLGTPDVKKFWEEIRYHHKYIEFVSPVYNECSGIGVLIINE